MSKRNYTNAFSADITNTKPFLDKRRQPVKKHTLDSDEEESEDENVLDVDDIEGEEEGIDRQEGEQKMTAFNMKEEMEEGHFDKDGHFIWNNEKEIRDNWLDNIDWQKIKHSQDTADKYVISDTGLGVESDSDEATEKFDEISSYKGMLQYMKPRETVNNALKRLGGDNMKLSSVERLKRKKAGTLHDNKEVTHLTELANEILTKQGNMDIYQETFEEITTKVEKSYMKRKNMEKEPELDMYADDFDRKEQEKIASTTLEDPGISESTEKQALMWEFKWNAEDDKILGPYSTTQMIKWAKDKYFKDGVMVRKCGGEDPRFYTSNRIDFELYE